MVTPGDSCGRESMSGSAAAKVNPQDNLHDILGLIRQAERVLLGTGVICKPAVDKAIGYHAHPLDIPKVPNTVLVIPALNLPQPLLGDVDVVIDGTMHVVVSTWEVSRIYLSLVLVYILSINGRPGVIRIQVPEYF